jgi:PHD/YefM family antitoxin component YafN of YafNO toxin-antitoxin module
MTTASVMGKHQTGWITISMDEYESMKETIEVLSDVDIMNQIEEGKRDNIKVKDFEDMAKELGI